MTLDATPLVLNQTALAPRASRLRIRGRVASVGRFAAVLVIAFTPVSCGSVSASDTEASSDQLRSSSVRTESTAAVTTTTLAPDAVSVPSTEALDLSASSPSTAAGYDPFDPERSNPLATGTPERVTTTASTNPPLDPSEPERATSLPADVPKTIAADAMFTATAADVVWTRQEADFDPDWGEEQLANWRRSLYLESRFKVIETLIGIEAIDIEASLSVDGMSPPYKGAEEYLADLHNNAERIMVTNKGGSTEPLSHWFAALDALPEAVYESMIEHVVESP